MPIGVRGMCSRCPRSSSFARRGIHAPKVGFPVSQGDRVYMQDYLLWWPIAGQIRRYFRPRPEFLRQVQERNPWFFAIPAHQRLSVHVRRGDYVNNVRQLCPARHELLFARRWPVFPG